MSVLSITEVEPSTTILPDVWGKKVYGVGRSTCAVLKIGDQIVSSAILIRAQAHLRHKSNQETDDVLLGGIGSVLTWPQHRGKGYGTQLVEDTLTYMSHEWGVRGGVLFCASSLLAWYVKRGWKRVSGYVFVNQPDEPDGRMSVPKKINTMVYGINNDVDLVLESLPW